MTIDPLAPDAPILHLLSVKNNPLLEQMTPDQLTEVVKKYRTLATSAPTLSAKLNDEGKKIRAERKPARAPNPEQQKRKAILDSI